MGYETKLIIGTVYNLATEDETRHFFGKMAELDLCKCGYKGTLPDLIGQVTHKDNPLNLKEVYWSEIINPDEKAMNELVKKELISEDSKEEVSDIIESWESETNEDCYGAKLRAVPIQDVYDAMLKSQAETLIQDGYEYRRYTIGLGMLKGVLEGFKGSENIYCVLYGH